MRSRIITVDSAGGFLFTALLFFHPATIHGTQTAKISHKTKLELDLDGHQVRVEQIQSSPELRKLQGGLGSCTNFVRVAFYFYVFMVLLETSAVLI